MITKWNISCVNAVISGERKLTGLELQPYVVGDHAWTGGPVLRGPWGSIGGMQSEFEEYERKCKQFTAACIHGQMIARRQECEASQCIGWLSGHCHRCGGTQDEHP